MIIVEQVILQGFWKKVILNLGSEEKEKVGRENRKNDSIAEQKKRPRMKEYSNFKELN